MRGEFFGEIGGLVRKALYLESRNRLNQAIYKMEVSDILNQGKFTRSQLELLKFFSTNPTDEEVENIRQFFIEYYAEKILDEVDAAIKVKGYSQSDVEGWAKEHNRTPYLTYRKYMENKGQNSAE